nr:MAG TPA: hypothetical protein [Caudoviricetes sp.]
MRTREFDRNLKYDAVPRTTVPIELFNREAYASFDTTHDTKSRYADCTECVVMSGRGFQPATRRPCRIKADD